MSRSLRKTPIFGMTTACSGKAFKRAEHHRERAAVRTRLGADCDAATLPGAKTFGDPWHGGKDGKKWKPGTVAGDRSMRK